MITEGYDIVQQTDGGVTGTNEFPTMSKTIDRFWKIVYLVVYEPCIFGKAGGETFL